MVSRCYRLRTRTPDPRITRHLLGSTRHSLLASRNIGIFLWVLGTGVLGLELTSASAQSLPRVDIEGTLRITPMGEGILEAHYRYPGNLYNAVKQLYASNPYVLFRSLTGENQPQFYIDRKSLKIEFDDANRGIHLTMTLVDLFRYTPDGWRLRLPELLEHCKVAAQEVDRVVVSCAYTQSDAFTAGQTVQYMETDTILLPPGAQWVEFSPKEGNVTYRLDLPLTARNPGLWPWLFTIGTVFIGLIAVVTWLIRLPKPAVAAEPVAARAVPAASARASVRAVPAPAGPASTSAGTVELTAALSGETIALAVLTLVGVQGAVQGQSFPVPPTGLIIGRDAAFAQVVIPDPHVSRRQAQIQRNAQGQFVLVNLSQTNPTLVNGHPVEAEHILRPGDRIQVAGHVLEVRS
ncbi:MAG: FHA domain-containing protein [Acidobacteria bacterium]|nr:FHA domain-containing protein [Acidobacteriota bacterium]MDW7984490.1 FHA domain-containing protein [Acidobacteriota bacterium]